MRNKVFKYKTGFDIYYELKTDRWGIVPMYRSDTEYLTESMAVYTIHDNVLTLYWDRLR